MRFDGLSQYGYYKEGQVYSTEENPCDAVTNPLHGSTTEILFNSNNTWEARTAADCGGGYGGAGTYQIKEATLILTCTDKDGPCAGAGEYKINSDGTITIPEERTKQLGELMLWLYGSKSEDIEPMVKSQNPDLKRLDAVLQNKEATISLQNNASLNTAFEITIGGSEVLFSALVNAKVAVQKALANSAFYDGEEEILRIAGTIADTADNLYSTLEKIYKQHKPEKTKRLSE